MCLSVEMMVVIGGSVTASSSLSPPFLISNAHINLNFSPKVRLQNSLPFGIMKTQLRNSLSYISKDFSDRPRSCELVFYSVGDYRPRFFCQPAQRHGKKITSQCGLFSVRFGHLPKLRKYTISLQKAIKCSKFFKKDTSILFVRLLVGMVLVMTISFAVFKTPSWALTEENLIFLEAWRTIDRAYVDKTFNGQSWFRYRENALLNEPMKSREETYMAIRKMLATLDDPFTRFLEPEKFKSLRSGTQGALTGVGLSIGYPTGGDGLRAGLVVISAAPGSPANKAGILSGDVILKIDDTSTETMGIYDAAERLQGTKGSAVELTIRSGPEIKQLSLKREKVSLNPVQSRLCEIPALGKDASRVGYIKLASFNQNASGAVREAIETLRRNNVNAFVLDLRDNSGGLFPEGIEIAKIWLEKGVIVYISDSQGVRDIYDTDGSNAIAAVEPLAVLVNKGTASASEILAGALKDNKRAMVFGEPTYGKGKIQSVFELSDGSGLAVTVAQYETPAHTDINKVGVIPDHPLPASFPKDDKGFCRCLQDPDSACYLNRVKLFSQ
ncbi:carboxyl-terminal-processing peptidase 2, chloroplastic-like isoform X2 [Camellia sinensis]|uniref:carboxyl-terminal-processing peptidase 2, chloroplastic-like isoform X2 n=1 Tax=Camellia sinensis TaxID=4442 RepID=UPI0010361483|nr:carboxyl-terminal-processing peptidase 2, chloroplastic-like isoform X2 [Camellia sinensis]